MSLDNTSGTKKTNKEIRNIKDFKDQTVSTIVFQEIQS